MNLPELFRIYLISQKSSPRTIKNYLSDIRTFWEWLAKKTGIHYQIAGPSIFSLFTQETLQEYQKDLLSAKTPPSTINRYLSALRKLGEFAKQKGWLTENPAIKIPNLSPFQKRLPGERPEEKILEEFCIELKKQKVSPLTIKNYLTDLRHFLNWLTNEY